MEYSVFLFFEDLTHPEDLRGCRTNAVYLPEIGKNHLYRVDILKLVCHLD